MKYAICIRTVSGKELQVESDLVQAGYEVYFPRKRIDQRTKRTRKVIIEALWPPYMFVMTEEGITDLHPIKQHKLVAGLVQFGGQLAKVSTAAIEALKLREDAQGVHESKTDYAEGDKVRVRTGHFKQYEAVIESLDRNDRAIIKIISSGVEIGNVPLIDLEPAA